jgi:hypothetical protein
MIKELKKLQMIKYYNIKRKDKFVAYFIAEAH